MKKTLMMIIAVITFASASPLFANGALAIDTNQGSRYGYSHDFPSTAQAQNKALKECGRGCKIVGTFSRGCAAYAADQHFGSTVYGWGKAKNSNKAKNTALRYCRKYGGTKCTIRVWGCNRN